jgi:hypothetical protein
MHSMNAYILNRLNAAKENLANNLNYSCETVSGIFHLPDLGDEIERKHLILIQESQDVANILYAKLAMSVCESNTTSWFKEIGDSKKGEIGTVAGENINNISKYYF